ncbi:hypothetical protein SAY86_003533 [Trapa natans]|uniref:Uncharacterized protein n=1 Tax=Trapa natans TaxID=22666 RepID=A0AAN7RMW1_TRANT|nr:hypothetical protein SAY86_003533 [Trapa natans]
MIRFQLLSLHPRTRKNSSIPSAYSTAIAFIGFLTFGRSSPLWNYHQTSSRFYDLVRNWGIMGLFRKIAGLLGFGKDDVNRDEEGEEEEEERNRKGSGFQTTGLPRKGFSVPVQVAVGRSNPGPLLVPCDSGDGGVQGLRWYAKRLRIDEDGDVAHEFIEEVSSGTEEHKRQFPKFHVRYSTQPAKVKEQVMSPGGRIQHCVEHQGSLQWCHPLRWNFLSILCSYTDAIALENAEEIPKTMKS